MTKIERFTSAMSEKNWNTVLNDNDPQNVYTTFHYEFSEMYDACFPIKCLRKVIEPETVAAGRDEPFYQSEK